MSRRRELLKASGVIKNGLVAGSVGSGTSVAEVNSDGNVVITRLGTAWSNRVQCPFKFPINVSAGDTVRVKLTRIVAGASGFFDLYLIGTPSDISIATNQSINFGNAIPADKSATVSADRELTAFSISRRNNDMTTPTTFSVQIYVNGVEQF